MSVLAEDDLVSLVGTPFPGGTYTIEPWRAWLLADAVLAAPPSLSGERQVAHPLLAWMAAVGAMGVTWDEFFSWFDATAADGPVFGEHETTLHRPLYVGETVHVSGSVTSAARKVGRRTGTFDVVGYTFSLSVGDEPVATCWNSIVFPRRGVPA